MNDSPPSLKQCSRCEILSFGSVTNAGRLYLWLPVVHTLSKITAYLQQAELPFEIMRERSGLCVVCQAGQAQELARELAELLTPQELQDTQVLFIQGSVQPQLHDFSEITSLQRFIKFSQSDWLVEMLTAKRFTSHFQPIVYIEDTSRIYGYEALLRGLDPQGNLVMPGQILELAAEAGLLPQVDRLARQRAIQSAHQQHINQLIFINFAPTALYDPVSCLRTTVEAIDQAGIAHDHVVFEVVESDKPQSLDHLRNILNYYREAGFLVALDDLGSGYSSLNLLHQLRPDFIKLDQDLIRGVHQDPYKASITEKILELTHCLNIKTVAEGIESLEELSWLQQHGASFAQGYLIAKPAAIPIATTPALLPSPAQAATLPLYKQPDIGQQSESERIVAAITQRIRQSLNLSEILQTTATEVRQLFDVDRVVIYRFEPDWSGVVAVESVAEGWMPILGMHLIDTCFQATQANYYQQGHSRAIENVESEGLADCHLSVLRELQIRANLVVPILQQKRLWGLLIAHQCRAPRTWHPSEIQLFNQLAAQAAIAIQQSELYQQLQQANQELQRLAFSDGLTQVFNRRHFDEYLNTRWHQLAQEQASLSLILCDVDYFKRFNDTYGHLAGDDALRQVAHAITQAAQRSTDLVARYGGEEFAIVLPYTDAAGVLTIAQKIRMNIKELQIPHVNSAVDQHITLSLGMATLIPNSDSSPAHLIAIADQALYQAKAEGRDRLFQASPPDTAPLIIS